MGSNPEKIHVLLITPSASEGVAGLDRGRAELGAQLVHRGLRSCPSPGIVVDQIGRIGENRIA
jgi:hypothetical protein